MAVLISVFTAAASLAGAPQSLAKSQSQSQSQSQKKAAHSGVPATVVTDGALVYAAPDEDASILAQLPGGQHVRVSKGVTSGAQRFHKIVVGKKIGYIDDIDVSLGGAGSPKPPPKRKKGDVAVADTGADKDSKSKDDKKKKDAAEKAKRKKEMAPREPMFFTRFVGLEVGAREFNEDISGVDATTGLAVYGLKITGPDVLFKGPVMDINLLMHYGAPPYYNAISGIQPSGFVFFLDAMFLLPLLQHQNDMIYISAGPLVTYSKFSIVNSNRVMDLEDIQIGGDLAVGGGFRVGKVALKLEGKYWFAKHTNKGLLASLQVGF